MAALGCGGSGRPVKVQGTVTLDGKPLPDAVIVFTPEGQGPPASGVSGSDGTFRLTTFSSGDGAMPGSYKITVTLGDPDTDLGKGIDMKDPKTMMGAMKEQMEKRKAAKKKADLPATYSDPAKTTLKQTIPPPDGKVTLELRSQGG